MENFEQPHNECNLILWIAFVESSLCRLEKQRMLMHHASLASTLPSTEPKGPLHQRRGWRACGLRAACA